MSRSAARLAAALAAIATLVAGLPQPASAEDPLRIADLTVVVDDGVWQPHEAPWQTRNAFRLNWTEPGTGDAVAVEYQLWNGAGLAVGPRVRVGYRGRVVGPVKVPNRGAYLIQLWLADGEGRTGAPVAATLRYDDIPPAAPAVTAPDRWLGADEPAMLSLAPSGSGSPASGIQGYAISLDHGAGSFPCAETDHCSGEEIDVRSAGAGEIALGPLPEGTTVARVVAVSGAGVPSSAANAAFRVDATRPTVRLAGIPVDWADGPVRVEATATDQLSGMVAAGPAGPFTAVRVDDLPPTVGFGPGAAVVVAGSGVHEVAYYARDAAGNVADGSGRAAKPQKATVRIDEGPPEVKFAAVQDLSEPERVEATVADALSGPSAGRGTIALRPAGSTRPFEALPTGVGAGRLVARWDSDAYPPGEYEFRAVGYDNAGNSATGVLREHGGRMVLVNPLKTPVAIEAGFDRGAAGRTVAYGHGVRLGGRLSTAGGRSPAGLEVIVSERFAPGSANPARTSRVRTGADGSFSIRLAPGPDRDVVASYAGDRLLSRSTSRTVHLGVRASLRLRTSAAQARVGGPPIVFSGRLAGAGADFPSDGRPVELQFRYPGATWRTFRTLRTDARGRFRYRYAFSDDDSRGVRFRFRAVSPAEADWPYDRGCSKPVTVIGR